MQILFSIIATFCFGFTLGLEAKKSTPKIKKESKSYPVPGKMLKNMDAQELDKVIVYAKETQDRDLAFKAFYHIINILQDHNQIKVYKLDLADYCFKLEDWAKAAARFEEFCLLYPGCDKSEYAQYKLILCTFYLSLGADRDQSDTIKTLNLITHFLKRAKDQKLISEMESIYKTCRKRLFEHEVLVVETSLQQQKFIGAQKRIEHIQANFVDIPEIEKYVSYLQEMTDLVKNPETRPFLVRINLQNALTPKVNKTIKKSDVQKAVSFFVA